MDNQLVRFTVFYAASLLLCPLLAGVINKVKAFFAGRRGVRVLQLYCDIFKLLKKERVHSRSASWLLPLAPVATLALTMGALLFLPLGTAGSPLGFAGDAVLFFYLLATARFLTVLAALETGSSFEGMGASREVQFAALAEGTVFAMLALLAMVSGSVDLAGMLSIAVIEPASWMHTAAAVLAAAAFFIVLLCENCRVPFDDPETHLELTMIHEAMVLDYGGPDLAAVFYGAVLKLWLFAVFFVSMLLPGALLDSWQGMIYLTGGVFVTAAVVGIVESSMARSRFLKVPQLLAGATVMVLVAVMLWIFFAGGAK
ncbi:MAG: NADH-quinone oxidoreductase subunit H [Lentisphaeria bacterium]|nr:NADH-quinone oxidoreductase subunit H [Lentisphaeria bacterium]